MARPRSFDPDHVLHAAERQFRTSGYNGTSVDDISAATGLGRGSLYAAFDGKHGVLLATNAILTSSTELLRPGGDRAASCRPAHRR